MFLHVLSPNWVEKNQNGLGLLSLFDNVSSKIGQWSNCVAVKWLSPIVGYQICH